MHGGRAASAAQGFTVEDGHLCGYEGERRGQSHPENAGPNQRVSAWQKNGAKYTLLVEWKTNKVAKVNSYGSFGLGVEFGTWR